MSIEILLFHLSSFFTIKFPISSIGLCIYIFYRSEQHFPFVIYSVSPLHSIFYLGSRFLFRIISLHFIITSTAYQITNCDHHICQTICFILMHNASASRYSSPIALNSMPLFKSSRGPS